MKDGDDFFVGWSAETPRLDRRFLIGAAIGLVGAAAGAGMLLGEQTLDPGGGDWNAGDVLVWRGVLSAAPYPALLTIDENGAPRTAFLATQGKTAVRLPTQLIGQAVTIRASLIARGRHAMLAVTPQDWIEPDATANALDLSPWLPVERGEAMLVGEILDAKCWFGAMRPGFGRTHKSCAALCARGGLPLAFCETGFCSADGVAPLFVDGAGRAHGRSIISMVADPVLVRGRLVQVGDILQLRADAGNVRRL